jgi:hypothetical protein
MESMSNADLSDRESEAALEAMICLLRPLSSSAKSFSRARSASSSMWWR